MFNLHHTNNEDGQVKQDDHLHPEQANLENRRSSFRSLNISSQITNISLIFFVSSFNRPPLVRSPNQHEPGILDAVSNVVEFVKDERTYRGRRNYLHSRYPKGTSSASTSPDLDRHRDRPRTGHDNRVHSQKPRLYRKGTTSSSSSPCYTYDSYQNRHNQSSYESYDYDTNVLNGKSRSPSPSQRNGMHLWSCPLCSSLFSPDLF